MARSEIGSVTPSATAAPADHPSRPVGVFLGLAVASFAMGIGHLVSAIVARESSPIVAVGQAAISLTPESLKSFAIRTFGEQDKVALIVGMVVVLAIVAAVAGVLSLRRPVAGTTFLLALGAVGVAAALTRPSATWTWAIPSLAAVAAGVAVLRFLLRSADASTSGPTATTPVAAGKAPHGFDRRTFVRAALAVGGAAIATGVAGTAAGNRRFAATDSRASVRIPPPVDGAAPISPGAELGVPDVSPFVTPNGDFYRVDTALIPPQVRAEDWTVRIHGMVDRPIELDFEQLVGRDLVERVITLSCVSNEVGGPYAGNARWTGTLLRPLLEEAGIDPASTQLVSRSIDGMSIGTPTAVVMDGRDAMLAVAMNGEPLPIEHGFPVRMLVPGLYGYVSATKWITEIEATTFEAFDAYWVERGWTEDPAGVNTMARIDTPKPLAQVGGGSVAVAGVAWAQHRGIERVEVRVDGGSWIEAELGEVPNADTWRQWVWRWDASPGRHTLEARATDGNGEVQPEERTPPFPDGATGWHSVVVTVG